MSKTKKDESPAAKPTVPPAKQTAPSPSSLQPARKEVTLVPEEMIHVRVTMADGTELEHVVQARGDGYIVTALRAPEAPPVQDPNPISGT